jgi:acyl carrier protein
MTPLEERLRATLATLMDVEPDQLSVDTDLGEQGVDSLIGLRFARGIEELLGREIELEWLFDHPSIAQLASFLAAAPDRRSI